MIRHLYRVLGPEGSRPLTRLLVILVAAAVLQGAAFALLVPVLRALLGDDPGQVWPWLALLAVVTAGFAATQAAALGGGFTVGSRLSKVLHTRLADHALGLPLGWFTGRRAAELSRLAGQGVIQVMNMPAHLLRPLTSSILTPVTVLVATFFFDVRMAFVLLACAPVLLAVHLWSTSVIRGLDRGRDAAIDESADRVLEFALNQPVLRAFGRTVDGHAALDSALVEESRADRRLINRGIPGLVSFAFAARMVFALALALAVSWTLDDSLDAATLIALLVLTGRLTDSVSAAADLGAGLRIARGSLERLEVVLDEPLFTQPSHPQTPVGSHIEFDGVDFEYGSPTAGGGDAAPARVLHQMSFHAPERSLTALVGPSGSGKTTVARLLARFWDTTGGSVRIGGVDVRDISPGTLAGTVSIVFQDTYLFEGTIEENVRIGDLGATRRQLDSAAELSGLDKVVAELPDGWATRVGEGGTALSGGQRQRVSIARALLKDAPILILDEATAALDQENEATLVATVQALAKRKTVLVIAHRLSTITGADQILVMVDGQITERGTHSELAEAGGTYTGFWRQRTHAEGWRLAVTP